MERETVAHGKYYCLLGPLEVHAVVAVDGIRRLCGLIEFRFSFRVKDL